MTDSTWLTNPPTVVKQQLSMPLNYSAAPFKALVDGPSRDRRAMIKPHYLDSGLDPLQREILAFGLARYLNIEVPPLVVVEVPTAMQTVVAQGRELGPLALASEFITHHGKLTKDNLQELETIENKSFCTALTIFDTWICNGDRYFWPYQDSDASRARTAWLQMQRANLGNLLVGSNGRGKRLMAIDHGQAFARLSLDEDDTTGHMMNWSQQPLIYGLLPAFADMWDHSQASHVLGALGRFTEQHADEALGKLPASWALGSLATDRWRRAVFERAQVVSSRFPTWMLPYVQTQPTLMEPLVNDG